MQKRRTLLVGGTLFLVVAILVIVFGSRARGERPPAPSPPEVEVVQIEQRDVPIYSEWIGTLDGMVNAEIRAQVSGYLLSKNYTEGSYVRKGQSLFEIDPRPFRAALDQANGEVANAQGRLAQAHSQLLQSQAQLAEAEANKARTKLDLDRYTKLANDGVIARQQYDYAVQANLANEAQVKAGLAGVETARSAIVAVEAAVESARAAARTAELNLGFTKITSPIDGIAGIAQAQVGNLVGPTSGTLTTVSTVDPIKVYFTLTEQEYLNNIRRNPTQSEQAAANKRLDLELVLADGTIFPQRGKFFVADREVDQRTGAIRLAGIFPNPGNALRPGQYGRVRAATRLRQDALLVPQRAVAELQGSYQVGVVSGDQQVAIRPVKVGERVEAMWLIEDGLKPGDQVVVEGMQKIRPGVAVNVRPFETASRAAR